MYNTDKHSLLKAELKTLKKNTLRYNEYYNMQSTFDNLYKQSQNNSVFKNLFNLITKDENILLAYRNIKRNNGSKTAGTNRRTIEYWEQKPISEFLYYIRKRLNNYQPQTIRRVEIPKSNGKTRPLGIPCIEDRIIQQCIKQVLEPICEAKFHPNSYGFRPNRSTEHAVAYLMKKVNLDKNYFMVDIDIEGFFDHVNHAKLLKQIWTMGIRDKKVISIIGSMLKAKVEGLGVQLEGVPQGGILSPLLSNIVLNELDWWISNQWETYESHHKFSQNFAKYNHLRNKSKLKEIYIVRYADDFKITCKSRMVAEKIFIATQQWLKERLSLDISQEKSSITDVRKSHSEFLGFKIKACQKGQKLVVKSHMSDKAISNVKKTIKEQLKYIQKHPNALSIYTLNRLIAGLHNYYEIATEVSKDFSKIDYSLSYSMKKRLSSIKTNNGLKTYEYQKKYVNYRGKPLYALGVTIYPISFIRTKSPKLCNQKVTNYSADGRKSLHTTLGYIDKTMLNYLATNPVLNRSIEYNDNRLSLYSAQKGLCAISGLELNETMEAHHIIPLSQGGTDRYNNLILITNETHKLIHVVNPYVIQILLSILKPNAKMLNKVNKLRKIIGNDLIMND